MRRTRAGLVVVGALIALVGLGLVIGGGIAVWAHATQRDSGGYYNSPTLDLSTEAYALTADVDLGAAPGPDDWFEVDDLGTFRLRVRPVDAGGDPLFVGIARTADVDRWLAGTAHTHVDDVEFDPTRVETTEVGGTSPAPPLRTEGPSSFWVASSIGSGARTLTWEPTSGEWTAVLMNADGSAGLAADVVAGAKTGVLLPIGIVLLAVGLVVAALAALLIVKSVGRTAAVSAAAPTHEQLPLGLPSDAYPARLDAHLDEDVSRWLWLVKWVLVVPHAVVLAFLWLAVVVLTMVAGVAILFTGRYPRSIFDFNVGVMRWTWRVGYWSFAANGTDRYPPFSLAADPTYPADLAIDYPEHLSRGLVLVKWWLLAIPHYLVVAIFAGGWNAGRDNGDGGIGLVGALVFIAVVILLVRSRYPRGLFDFVMGLNRWCFRVFAYAALLRDEYPPFRLDMGGRDPGSPAPA